MALECSSCNCILRYFIQILKNQCRDWARIFHDSALWTSKGSYLCSYYGWREYKCNMVKHRWHWYYVINGWCSAVLSLGCCFGACTLYPGPQPAPPTPDTAYYGSSLALAISVFPLAHIHPTPVCDHHGSLPLPVSERSKVILNPPRQFKSKHNWGFSLTMHVCTCRVTPKSGDTLERA